VTPFDEARLIAELTPVLWPESGRVGPTPPRPAGVVGMSDELKRYGFALHDRQCAGRITVDVACPCRTAVARTCTTCRERLFMIVAAGGWCRHLAEHLGRRGLRQSTVREGADRMRR
jgi:hypothetical protein